MHPQHPSHKALASLDGREMEFLHCSDSSTAGARALSGSWRPLGTLSSNNHVLDQLCFQQLHPHSFIQGRGKQKSLREPLIHEDTEESEKGSPIYPHSMIYCTPTAPGNTFLTYWILLSQHNQGFWTNSWNNPRFQTIPDAHKAP